MRTRGSPAFATAALILALAPCTAAAQEGGGDAGAPAAAGEEEAIVVTGARGAPLGGVAPEHSLDAAEISGYGAADLTELLEQLAPLVQGAGEAEDSAPIILLNGKRVSSFREIRAFPPEALERVDVFPEALALRYGFRPDQKVVNFVLRREVRSLTADLRARLATAGGAASHEADGALLSVGRRGRSNFDIALRSDDAIFESERDVVRESQYDVPDPGRYRTLAPRRRELAVNGAINRSLWGDVDATVNGRFERDGRRSHLGAAPAGAHFRPLLRERETDAAHLGAMLSGVRRRWQWTASAEYDRTGSETRTDRGFVTEAGGAIAPLQNRTRVRNRRAAAELVVNGPAAALPAGEVAVTLKGGADLHRLAGYSRIDGVERFRKLGRNRALVRANVDLPILGQAAGSPLGALSLDMHGEAEHLSDVGTLSSYGLGFKWAPARRVQLTGSMLHDSRAPTIQQLSDPVLVTPNARVYDFARNETATVHRTTGGNPDLAVQARRVLKLGLSATPWAGRQLSLSAEYSRVRVSNAIMSFPTVSPALEAAFPARFERDAAGELVALDARPLNFAAQRTDALRWGVRLSQPLRRANAPRPAAGKARAETRRPRNSGRIQASLHHKWRFTDEALVSAGGPTLDFLNGAAKGVGGRPRHEVEAKLGISQNGLTARATARWAAGSTVLGDARRSTLHFSDLATVDFALSANLERLGTAGKARGWLRGARLSLVVRNVFDDRLRVRDDLGATPVRYLPDILDPFGRSVRIGLRKQFR